MPLPHRALAVCGPTASGKTSLALDIAQALSAEIVNVDSVQVYQGLNVGSAKPSEVSRRGIPHHIFDVFEPDKPAHVADYRKRAIAAVADIEMRGKLPILVGGSGLYFTALLHGLADTPATEEDVRVAVSAISTADQYQELMQSDPVTAHRLNPNDRQRISRALEIYRMTGRPASEFVAQHGFSQADIVSLVIVLCRPRDELYQRIEARSQQMVNAGLLAETRALMGTYGRIPTLETLGYKQACDCIEGTLEESSLAHEIALYTRRFAKRQMTFWRNEPVKRGWVVRPSSNEQAEEVSGFSGFSQRAQRSMKGFRAFQWSVDEVVAQVRTRLKQNFERTEVWYVRA